MDDDDHLCICYASHRKMKHHLLTTIAAVVLTGFTCHAARDRAFSVRRTQTMTVL
ncbi:MAG: hypothetical protein VYB24_07765 [Pseudomonadota bacterium]|nr:hypothetical protein [Pseudomonadota bacterium]